MDKKVVIITGASSGIGKATAALLLSKHYVVYALARRLEKMEDLKQAGAHVLSVDVSKDNDMVTAVASVIENEGRIDVLVNNAGYGSYGSVEDVPIDEARRQFEVNVFGLGRMTQLVSPIMRAQHSGTIINITSIGGKVYMPFGGWYHSTKHAVEGLSDCLRMELAPFGVKVVIVEPGPIKTEWDGIAAENLIKTSGKGAYKTNALGFANMLRGSYEGSNASDPSVIADTIVKAIVSGKPKTRYVAGKMAKALVFSRWLFSDKLFDWVVSSEIKRRS
jgi:short-subunit dehydrogenase